MNVVVFIAYVPFQFKFFIRRSSGDDPTASVRCNEPSMRFFRKRGPRDRSPDTIELKKTFKS